MTSAYYRFCLTLALVAASGPVATPGYSQIIPDSTVNSIVTPIGTTLQIDGGTTAGTNLFHSFQDFSIPTGITAFFNNPLSIENIITRVTGSKISNIDGLIRANGIANLFLINPNGLVFGPNASLDIGGSFLGTTANSIQFADGREFSATNPTSNPLLTVSVPMGLQMGPNSGNIIVQGTGHRLRLTIENPIQWNSNPVEFRVTSGNTLALVGNSITLDGGIVTAESGQIELGSVQTGIVNFNITSPTWNFDYRNVQAFGDIQFAGQALADASGIAGGSIQLQGRNININEGSVALVANFGNIPSGNITVNASEYLELKGDGPYGFTGSLLITNNLGNGKGGDLEVSTPQLLLQDGGEILARNFRAGVGGNIFVNATESIKISGFSRINPSVASVISPLNSGSGQGGNLQVVTRQLTLQDGGAISTLTVGTGTGGNNIIRASEFIEAVGENPLIFTPSGIAVTSFNRGDTGQLTIQTSRLIIRDGATISAATQSPGNSGNLTINASDTVQVSGVGQTTGQPSKITAGATVLPPRFQQAFNLPPLPTGTSGDLIINTPLLQVSNDAVVSVSHEGIGNAGNLKISADEIRLDDGGTITAATQSGEGGSMNLQTETLLMRRGSRLITNAGGSGNGGNITLDSSVIAGLENSDIAANAIQGAGGNIQISTQGIFGLEFRSQPTDQSDITASSQFGVSGNVSISTPDVQPEATLGNLPTTLIDPNTQITSGCDVAANNRFVATGRGGLPSNPTQRVEAKEHPWTDIRDLSAFRRINTQAAISTSAEPSLVEANGWKFNDQGQVEIYVTQTGTVNFLQPTCAGSRLTRL
jgi:filamentous hemagglutinin family protein